MTKDRKIVLNKDTQMTTLDLNENGQLMMHYGAQSSMYPKSPFCPTL